MEFKGTKGKWRKGCNYDGDIVADENDRQPSKCVCFIIDTRKERSKYDALLITKAPEMLKMLKDIHHNLLNEEESIDEAIIYKLIKEATEL